VVFLNAYFRALTFEDFSQHRRMLANPPPAPSTASAPLTVPVSGIHFGSDTPVAANTMDE
jgi:hypothetical protein